MYVEYEIDKDNYLVVKINELSQENFTQVVLSITEKVKSGRYRNIKLVPTSNKCDRRLLKKISDLLFDLNNVDKVFVIY